jgi:ferredoxin-NADP reductase
VRTVRDVVFREELDYLRARFPTLHATVLVSRDPDTPWDGPRGQITREVIAEFVPNLDRGPVLLCGPDPMMSAMRTILREMGVPDDDVVQEAFVSRPTVDEDGAAVQVAGSDQATSGLDAGGLATVTFTRSKKTISVSPEQTLLDGAEAFGIELPFECRSGICGQCKTHLAAGRVQMDTQDALSAVDRARGFILACQAHALTNLEVEA